MRWPHECTHVNIVLTGGSGFIGTHLARLLIELGHDIVLADLERSHTWPERWQRADVRNADDLRRTLVGTDLVIHLAAEHADDVQPVSRYWATNVEGMRALLGAMNEIGVHRLVHFSSVSVYGPGEDERSPEPLHPEHDYGRSKWAAEQLARAWQEQAPGVRALRILRPAVVYGTGHRGNMRRLMAALDTRWPLMIGDGSQHKSICFVGNLVAATLFDLAESPGVVIHNVVDAPDVDMATLVSTIRQALGRSSGRTLHIPKSWAMALGHLADAAARVLPWRPSIGAERIRKFCTGTRFSADRLSASGFKAPYTHIEGLIATVDDQARLAAMKQRS